MPVYDDAYEQVYRDAKGHDRTCLNCGRLRREANTRPADAFFADSYRSVIGEVYAGEEPRDRRHTDVDADVGVFCAECGTTDSHTYVHDGETLSTADLLGRAEDVFDTIEELFDVVIDREAAKAVIKAIKHDPERTNTPADDVLERAVGFGVARAVYRRETRFEHPSVTENRDIPTTDDVAHPAD